MPFPKFHMSLVYLTKFVWGKPIGRSHLVAGDRVLCKVDTTGFRRSSKPPAEVCRTCIRAAPRANVTVPKHL